MAFLCFIINFTTVFAGSPKIPLKVDKHFIPVFFFNNLQCATASKPLFSLVTANNARNFTLPKRYGNHLKDSLPKYSKDSVVVPFEYKQSALYQPYTLLVIDSVVDILLKKDSVKLSIDGYAFVEEGSDTICYYLSLNRALAVRDYVIGRGVDSTRIISLTGWGNVRSKHRKINQQIVKYNCRAELLLNYPLPPPPPIIQDRDEDGIADGDDKCPDEYGEKENNGCPDSNAIIVPFETQQYSLYAMTYSVLDSVIVILLKNPSVTISIEGYAYKKEGIKPFCYHLAKERADIVRRYLLSRGIAASRIETVKSAGYLRPLNAGRNPQEIIRNSRAEILFKRH